MAAFNAPSKGTASMPRCLPCHATCAHLERSSFWPHLQALVAAQSQKEQDLQERFKALAEEREDLRRALQAVPAQ